MKQIIAEAAVCILIGAIMFGGAYVLTVTTTMKAIIALSLVLTGLIVVKSINK